MHSSVDKDGQFTPEYLAYTKEVGICYDLVSIAQDILDRPIRLHLLNDKDASAHTDGKGVFIPSKHENKKTVTKHELSHIYFKSSVELRLAFVKELIASVEESSGSKLSVLLKEKLIDDLCFFINILDDIRVNSLWGLLCQGDGIEMEDWYFGKIGPRMAKQAKEDCGEDIENLFTYAILICLGQEAKSSRWGEFEADISEARDNVYYKSFSAALLLTKRLVLKIAKKLSEDIEKGDQSNPATVPAWGGNPNPLSNSDWEDPEQGDVVPNSDLDSLMKKRIEERAKQNGVKALSAMLSGERPDVDFSDKHAGFDWKMQPKPKNPKAVDHQVRALNRADVLDDEDFDKVMASCEDAGVNAAGDIRKAMNLVGENQATVSPDDYLTKNVKAKVHINRIDKADITPTVLDTLDLKTADKWKRQFQRVMGVLSTRAERHGYDLIPDVYVQSRISRQPMPAFRYDSAGRGFRLTLLVDMSGSMSANFHKVEKLAQVLQKSMEFPFVTIDVMGFNSPGPGVVNMFMFPKDAKGLRSHQSRAEGTTPISHAIQVAGRSLEGIRDEKHLFLLSDGVPVYQTKRGRAVSTKKLENWTRDAVDTLRSRSINVWCFMAGTWVPTDQSMNKMFGNRNWQKIDTDDIYTDSFSFITKRFMRYLRTV